MQAHFYWVGSSFVILLGILFTVGNSKTVFDQPINISDIRTPPRYLTRRKPFFLAKATFVGFCLAAYAFSLIFYRQIPTLIQFVPSIAQSELANIVKTIDDKTHPSWLVTVVGITIGFFYLLKTDFPGNVIYQFRSLVYSSISVPFACKRICEQIQHSLDVPEHYQQALANDTDLHIAVGDFGLSATDVLRQWAEIAYLDRWIRTQKEAFPSCEIFSDASFASPKVHNQFIALRELMYLYSAEQPDAESLAAITELLKELRSHHARYVSCLLLTQAGNRLEFYKACKNVGIDPGPVSPGNPIVYSALYVVVLATTVVLGPYLFAVAYDIFLGVGVNGAIFDQNTDYMKRWLISGLAVYFSPIFFILLIRNVAWQISPIRTYASLVTYAWVFVAAFIISTTGGVIARVALHRSEFVAWEQVAESLWITMPWSIGPALNSLYINYYLDRQADPAKEDIVQTRETIVPRLISALAFTTIIVILSLLIVAYQRLVGNIWSREETQVIVVGTIALITFSLCLVAQFGLRKRQVASDGPSRETALAEA
jgi:hypothetical protein